MKTTRNRYSAEFKARVALEAIREQKTINEIASHYGVHPNQVTAWKKQAVGAMPEVFSERSARAREQGEALKAALYQQIGQLKVELDWLKKKLDLSVEEKRAEIDPGHPELSISRQCELLGLGRSSYYDRPDGEGQENLRIMRLIDEQYTRAPFYGSRRMTAWLRGCGYPVNRKRVQRLMRVMGIEAIYPKRRLSQGAADHRIYPYLLKGVTIGRPDHVWSTDITYVPLRHGYVYLTAILDWYSRYVISWQISNTMDTSFCLEALERAMEVSRPEIFNSDQGSQFTSREFTSRLEAAGVRISMDGRGRVFDNIFVERLWRTVKYEDIYLKEYPTVPALTDGLREYFDFYNRERRHQALEYRTPADVYYGEA